MGRKSKIETHPDWKIIISRLASGEEYSNIIHDFPGITWFDLDYYSRNKLENVLSKSPELKSEIEGAQGDELLEKVRILEARTMEILDDAQDAGDLKTALLGIREARGCLELLFKAEGRIREQPIQITQLDIYDSPEWLVVGRLLGAVLEPYDFEIRQKVATALSDLADRRKED